MLQITKPCCQFKRNLQHVFQTGRYRFQDPTEPNRCLWSRQALRCVSAQRGIRLAAWVGVCPCKRRSSFHKWWLFHFHKCRGAHVRLCPRPCSSTHRSAQPTTARHRGPRNTMRSVLSCPLHPCTHRMCVIAKGLGSLQRLAHAAGHGQHSSASTSKRFFCVTWLDRWSPRPGFEKPAIIFPQDAVNGAGVQKRTFRPAELLLKRKACSNRRQF